jgi:hypothetical protein
MLNAVPTVASLKRQRLRLDRQRQSADRVIAAMRDRGLALHLSHEKSGDLWWLSDGTRVAAEVAKLVVAHPNIVSVGALFRNAPGQTYRFVN